MNIIKQLFCNHDYVYKGNYFMDETDNDDEGWYIKKIHYALYKCSKCDKEKKIILSKTII